MANEISKLMRIAACYEVAEICKPLFKHTGLTVFIYTKLFHDGTYWTLSNREDWISYFYKSRYKEPNIKNDKIKSGYYVDLSEIGVPRIQLNVARESFNADHWLNIIKNNDNFCDIYGFASSRNQRGMLNMYINNVDIFEHFIRYFKDKAENLIKYANNNRIWVPGNMKNTPEESERSLNVVTPLISREQFFSDTSISRYYIKSRNGYLTKREYECLYLLSKGKGVKEISNVLKLSNRTIGYYLNNLKIKFNCYSRSELLNLFNEV